MYGYDEVAVRGFDTFGRPFCTPSHTRFARAISCEVQVSTTLGALVKADVVEARSGIYKTLISEFRR
jgi:hypothetical protein